MITVSLAGKMANVCVYILISTTTHLRNFFGEESHRPPSPKVPLRLCLTVILKLLMPTNTYKFLMVVLIISLIDKKKMDFKRYLLLLNHLAIDRANNGTFLISSQLDRSEVPTFFPRVGRSKIKVPTFPPPQGQKFIAKSP